MFFHNIEKFMFEMEKKRQKSVSWTDLVTMKLNFVTFSSQLKWIFNYGVNENPAFSLNKSIIF